MIYKTGDVVRVRNDLKIGNEYGNLLFISDMNECRGKACLITGKVSKFYLINIDNSNCFWSKEMFIPIEKYNNFINLFSYIK